MKRIAYTRPARDTRDGGNDVSVQRWAVLSVLLGTFLGNLDASIANVALPTIAHDLSRSAADAVWVVNAYQLAMAMAVLPLAALGESLGYRRVFLAGLAVFTLASIACVAAPSLPVLVAARALQGLGGACTSTIVPALLRKIYPPARVGRGIAMLGLTVAVSAAIGPTVAAGILSIGGWRWLFAINVPLGVLAISLANAILPRSEAAPRPFDMTGAVLNALMIGLFITGVGALGVPDGAVSHASRQLPVAGIVLACVAGAALIRHQRGRTAPLVPLDLLRVPILSLSAATSVCSYTAQALAYLSLPFMLEHQLARSATTTGLLISPWPFVIVFIAPLAGRLSDRYAPGLLSSIGLAIMTCGLALLVGLPADPSNLDIAWRVAICGIGFGFFQTPNNRALLTSAPQARSGAAGGLMTMSRMIGMTLGAALAAVVFDLYGQRGARAGLLCAALCSALGVMVCALGFVATRRPAMLPTTKRF